MNGTIEVLTAIGTVIVIIGAIGAGFAYIRGSYNKVRIEALRGDNDDLRQRIIDLEHAEARHIEKEKSWNEERAHLVSENQTLMYAATQRAEVDKLNISLDNHHKAAMTEIKDVKVALKYIGGLLEKIAGVDDSG